MKKVVCSLGHKPASSEHFLRRICCFPRPVVLLLPLAVISLLAFTPRAQAQAMLVVTGGNGGDDNAVAGFTPPAYVTSGTSGAINVTGGNGGNGGTTAAGAVWAAMLGCK